MMWSTIITFLTRLLWLLQGGFLNRKVTKIVGDKSLVFLPKRYAFYSHPSHTPEVEVSLRISANILIILLKVSLTDLDLRHQKGAITYELSYGQQTCPNDAVPPDKHNCDSPATPSEQSHTGSPILHALSLASTS